MVRIAKQTDPQKLAELKVKIHNEDYLEIAIKRIAVRLTNEIINFTEEKNEQR